MKNRFMLLVIVLSIFISSCGTIKESQDPIIPSDEKIDTSVALIPEGWHIFTDRLNVSQIIKGDLNDDSLEDIILVIEKDEAQKNEISDSYFRRAILIALQNNDNSYTKSIISEILSADSGGVWGDPLDEISIKNGELALNYYGGSNYRWYSKYVYKYIDDGWYLIGSTEGSYFTGDTTIEEADEISINYLTGDFIERKTNENGNKETVNGNINISELKKLEELEE